jgi:hypothetical protein
VESRVALVAAVWPVLLVDLLVAALVTRTLWQLRTARATLTKTQRRFAELGKPRSINKESVRIAQDALTDVVGRGIGALEALDRKATFIPPALGVIAGIAVPRVAPDALADQLTLAAGISALAASLLSAGTALAVFFPRGYRAGPEPIESAVATGADEVSYRQGVVNALARAGVSIEGVVTHKAALFYLSVVFLGTTIFMLTLFGVSGGFASGETGSGT